MKPRKIMLSIHPKYVTQILNGSKRYEYRTQVAKQAVVTIFIYATAPISKVVAEVEIQAVIALPPDQLWEATKCNNQGDKTSFDEYYRHRDMAYAYKLGEVTVFKEARDLSDFGIQFAPQSFVYVSSFSPTEKEWDTMTLSFFIENLR